MSRIGSRGTRASTLERPGVDAHDAYARHVLMHTVRMTMNIDEALLARVVEAHPGVTKTALVGHLEEQEERELLQVVLVAQAVVTQDLAVVPQLLDDPVALLGHGGGSLLWRRGGSRPPRVSSRV